MRACFAILVFCACDNAPVCESTEDLSTLSMTIHLENSDSLTSLLLTPAKPSSKMFSEIVPLDESYRVLSPENLEEPLVLEPYEGPFFELDDAEVMFFLVSQFYDTNQDGVHNTGEVFLGLSETVLAYFNRVGCNEWRGLFHTGWNAVELRDSGPVPYALDGFTVPANLNLTTEINLTLEMDTSDSSRVVLTPEDPWNTGIAATPLVNVATAENLLLSLPEEIPEDHLQPYDVTGTQYSDWFYGVELPLWVHDQEAYTQFGETEGSVESFCTEEGHPVKIGHYPDADTLEEAFHLVAENRAPGWGVYVERQSGTWSQVDAETLGPLATQTCEVP